MLCEFEKKFTHYCCYKFDSCIDQAPPRRIQTLNKFVFNSKWPPLLLCLLERVHLKYYCNEGGSRPKNFEVLFPYRQVIALLRSTHTIHFSYTTHSNFKVFLKIQKLEVVDDIPKEPLQGYSMNSMNSFPSPVSCVTRTQGQSSAVKPPLITQNLRQII